MISIGTLTFEPLPEVKNTALRNTEREEADADLWPFMFRTVDGLNLLAGYAVFKDDEAQFMGITHVSGPDQYRRLLNAGRMSVEPAGKDQLAVRLRAMKFSSPDRQNLANVSFEELDSLINGDFQKELLSLGASNFGTAEELLGVENRNRFQLAMTFPKENLLPLAAAWGVTRVSAVANRFGA